jgi:hypothetical protein
MAIGIGYEKLNTDTNESGLLCHSHRSHRPECGAGSPHILSQGFMRVSFPCQVLREMNL